MATNFIAHTVLKKCITISCDVDYEIYAINCIKSIRRVSSVDVMVRTVDFKSEIIESIYNISNIVDMVGLSTKKRIKSKMDRLDLNNWRHNLCSDRSVYTCHSRFMNVLELFKIGYDMVYSIDCDFIFRKNFDTLWSLEGDISMHDPFGDSGFEDAILYKNTDNSIKFLKSVSDIISEDPFFWEKDMEAIQKSKGIHGLKISQLPIIYRDYSCSDDSLIWSGYGKSKFNSNFLYEKNCK